MNAIKEALYECIYASAEGLRTAHFMAWDSREAAEQFAHELQAEGVSERGTIQVRTRGDHQVRNADYPLL